MENQSAETLNNPPTQIRRSIFTAAIFVFQQVFDPKEHEGIDGLNQSIHDILGANIYNSIYDAISSDRNKNYRLMIQILLKLGHLEEFIRGLPEQDRYEQLGKIKKEKVDEKCKEILELVPLLTKAEIEEMNSEPEEPLMDAVKARAKVAVDIVVAAGIATLAGIALVGMGIGSLIKNDEKQK